MVIFEGICAGIVADGGVMESAVKDSVGIETMAEKAGRSVLTTLDGKTGRLLKETCTAVSFSRHDRGTGSLLGALRSSELLGDGCIAPELECVRSRPSSFEFIILLSDTGGTCRDVDSGAGSGTTDGQAEMWPWHGKKRSLNTLKAASNSSLL